MRQHDSLLLTQFIVTFFVLLRNPIYSIVRIPQFAFQIQRYGQTSEISNCGCQSSHYFRYYSFKNHNFSCLYISDFWEKSSNFISLAALICIFTNLTLSNWVFSKAWLDPHGRRICEVSLQHHFDVSMK